MILRQVEDVRSGTRDDPAVTSTALLTGGAGYIGSHTAVVLLQAGWSVVIVDNLANSSLVAVERVRELVGGDLAFHRVDIRDERALDDVFAAHDVDAVVHFAGLKAVGESVAKPLDYYDINVGGSVSLLKVMRNAGVRKFVFSSSATVYGDPKVVPVTERSPVGETTNPYGRTKFIIEDMLRDVAVAEDGWHIAILRYFNPIGAHPSGRIGEDPYGIPNNLVPNVMQVAAGRQPLVRVFGTDYPTADGTGIRDYIHVVDLAEGHLAGARAARCDRRRRSDQPRHGEGLLGARSDHRGLEGRRSRHPLRDRRPASGRHRDRVRRPDARPRGARLGSEARHRRDGRRPLALAVDEPARIRERRGRLIHAFDEQAGL